MPHSKPFNGSVLPLKMPYRQIQSNLATPILEVSWRQRKTLWVLVRLVLLSWIAQELPQYQSFLLKGHSSIRNWSKKLNKTIYKTDNLYSISCLQPSQKKHDVSINHCTIALRPWQLAEPHESHNFASMDRFESGGNRSRQASQKQEIQPMKLEKEWKRVQTCLKHGRTKTSCKNPSILIYLLLTFGQYMLANSSHEVDTLSDPGAPVLSQRKSQETLFSFMLARQSCDLQVASRCFFFHAGYAAEVLFETQTQPEAMQQCRRVNSKSCSFRHAPNFPSHLSSLQESPPNENKIEWVVAVCFCTKLQFSDK